MEGPDEYHALVVGTQNLKKKKKETFFSRR